LGEHNLSVFANRDRLEFSHVVAIHPPRVIVLLLLNNPICRHLE